MTKALQIEPARCTGSMTVNAVRNKFSLNSKHRWIAEEKFDGNRYLLQVRPNKSNQNYLTSRRLSVQTGTFVEKQEKLPHIKNYVFRAIFNGAVFDGEIVGGNISSDTQSEISKGRGDYQVWDILFYAGNDIRGCAYSVRRTLLESFVEHFPPWMKLVPMSRNPIELMTEVFKRQGEGIIIKHLNAEYGSLWVKVKQVMDTEDCIIYGYEMSTEGKYKEHNWIKNVKLAQWLPLGKYLKQKDKLTLVPIEVLNSGAITGPATHVLVAVGKVSSGLTEILRAKISKNPKKYLGQIAEVSAQFRLPTGRFRHPRFIRFRDDKEPKHCLWSK